MAENSNGIEEHSWEAKIWFGDRSDWHVTVHFRTLKPSPTHLDWYNALKESINFTYLARMRSSKLILSDSEEPTIQFVQSDGHFSEYCPSYPMMNDGGVHLYSHAEVIVKLVSK